MLTTKKLKPFFIGEDDEGDIVVIFNDNSIEITLCGVPYYFKSTLKHTITIDSNTGEVLNEDHMFLFSNVFQRMEISIYNLLKCKEFKTSLDEALVIAGHTEFGNKQSLNIYSNKTKLQPQLEEMFIELTKENYNRLIDVALTERNETLFKELLEKKESLTVDKIESEMMTIANKRKIKHLT